MKPFGLISDTHHHNWSAFSTTRSDGINSRLGMILDETLRCADEVRAAGGDTIFHGGDLFHVRGSIAPSVLNPTLDVYGQILRSGVKIIINAGNHDLEGKDASRVSSAITALEGIGCTVVNEPTMYGDMRIVPWINSLQALKDVLEAPAKTDRAAMDLLLHAPIDGVIPGLPDHGLDPVYLEGLGYRRIFAGHYHHHKEVVKDKVWSIGATTGQTWSDVRAKSGFLIVTPEEVKWRASRAPSFIEIDATTDPDEIPLIVDGNYVRAKITSSKNSDVEALRQHLIDCGAAGVTILQVKDSVPVARAGGTLLKAGATLEQSIGDFIKATSMPRAAQLGPLCQDILASVRSVRGAA